MNISIIIPTLNEAQAIRRLLDQLLTVNTDKTEIIVVDGGSDDDTVNVVKQYGVTVLHCDCSRAKQMNMGAKKAKYDVLYFVHADTLPPASFYEDGKAALENGFEAACYRSKFESKKIMLRLNEFFTQFYWLVSRGGDQSLFIKKTKFNAFGGFDETMVVMEEYPLIKALMQTKQLGLIPKPILISTRKYDNRSWLKVSRANYIAFKMFKRGASSEAIKKRYLELLG